MTKLLSIDDMLDAARESGMPYVDVLTRQLEDLGTVLGQNLAMHLGINASRATDEGRDFGGLLVRFSPAIDGQPCPAVIHQGDIDGDWE